MAEGSTTILVRYGEIGIKGPSVRVRFERRLLENLRKQLKARGAEADIEREWGRILLTTEEPERALDALRHTFGVVSASAALPLPTDLETMRDVVARESRAVFPEGASFAVKARRTGEHPYTSMDVQRQVGAAIFDANRDRNPSVDLENPDVLFEIEVRPNAAYYYRDRVHGPAGLPEGTQGKVGVILEDARSVLAAWLAMKRGASAQLVTDGPLRSELRAPLEALARYQPELVVHAFPAPDFADPAERRAWLLAAADAWTGRHGARALFTGDGLQGQRRFGGLDTVARQPVFRPLVGYAGMRLEELAEAVGIPDITDEAPAEPPGTLPTPPSRRDLGPTLKARETIPFGPLARELKP